MSTKTLKSDALLLLTAIIWGFAFVAQRAGMDYVGPFTFTGIRFALGSLVLFPFVLLINRKKLASGKMVKDTGAGMFRLGGALSVGMAYTLQVIAQRNAHPAHAAIILSLEAVFAALGGWYILGEILSFRGLLGCGLMLIGMLLSQLWGLMRIPHKR